MSPLDCRGAIWYIGRWREMEQSLQNISKQNRLEQWSRKIVACRSSGMTVRTWCQENGISEKTYYYWQQRLFQELANVHPQSNGFVDVTPSRVESSGQIAVKIHIAGTEVDIYNGADTATLETVLRVLRSC